MVFLANYVKKKVNVLEENRLVFSASEDLFFGKMQFRIDVSTDTQAKPN